MKYQRIPNKILPIETERAHLLELCSLRLKIAKLTHHLFPLADLDSMSQGELSDLLNKNLTKEFFRKSGTTRVKKLFDRYLSIRQIIAEGNTGLCGLFANKFKGNTTTIEYTDLVQTAILGLYRAIDRFEPAKYTTRVSSFAGWYILQSLQESVRNASNPNGLVLGAESRLYYTRIRDCRARRRSEGKDTSNESVASELGITTEHIQIIDRAFSSPNSLSEPDTGDAPTATVTVSDPDSELQYEDSNNRMDLERYFGVLTDREKVVINARFGIETGVPQSLDEVGNSLGISKERVRQIVVHSLRKIRKEFGIELQGKEKSFHVRNGRGVIV